VSGIPLIVSSLEPGEGLKEDTLLKETIKRKAGK
jgi:hypothetical protein